MPRAWAPRRRTDASTLLPHEVSRGSTASRSEADTGGAGTCVPRETSAVAASTSSGARAGCLDPCSVRARPSPRVPPGATAMPASRPACIGGHRPGATPSPPRGLARLFHVERTRHPLVGLPPEEELRGLAEGVMPGAERVDLAPSRTEWPGWRKRAVLPAVSRGTDGPSHAGPPSGDSAGAPPHSTDRSWRIASPSPRPRCSARCGWPLTCLALGRVPTLRGKAHS